MEKTSLTFYLPRKIFEKAKITAVKEESTFSDLAVSSTLMLIEESAFDSERPGPANDIKTMVYLTAVDLDIVWDIVQNKVPELKAEILAIISRMDK